VTSRPRRKAAWLPPRLATRPHAPASLAGPARCRAARRPLHTPGSGCAHPEHNPPEQIGVTTSSAADRSPSFKLVGADARCEGLLGGHRESSLSRASQERPGALLAIQARGPSNTPLPNTPNERDHAIRCAMELWIPGPGQRFSRTAPESPEGPNRSHHLSHAGTRVFVPYGVLQNKAPAQSAGWRQRASPVRCSQAAHPTVSIGRPTTARSEVGPSHTSSWKTRPNWRPGSPQVRRRESLPRRSLHLLGSRN